MIRIIAAKDYNDMSRKAANILSAQVILKNNAVLGLATGSTPIGIYKTLIHWYEKGDIDFSEVRTINLDEYVGLSPEHPQSYRYFMDTNFFNYININKNNTNVPDGLNPDIEGECARYHNVIESMGEIDIQLLGIGGNGHIGFNEPSAIFTNHVHCQKLADSTIEANSRFFASVDDVPKYAFSMGIGEIMAAKQIIVCASGKAKAHAVKQMIKGEVSPTCPASILKFHNNVTLIADEDALSELNK